MNTVPRRRAFLRLSARDRSIALLAAIIVGGIGVVFAWATAAPAGASPDEDFHLVNIWCPSPVERTCVTRESGDGRLQVQVPQSVRYAAQCYAIDFTISAACTDELTDEPIWTGRFDQRGDYPTGFHHVMSLFVGDDVHRSVVAMRVFNGLLAFALFGALAFFLPREGKRLLIYSYLPVSVPMITYLIVSANPSGWAITGVTVAWFGAYTALRGRNLVSRLIPWLIAGIGTTMAVLSRPEGGAYVGVAAASLLILHFEWFRAKRARLMALGGAMLIAVVGAIATNALRYLTDGFSYTADLGDASPGEVLVNNLFSIPTLLMGFARGHLNWLETPIPQVTSVTITLAFGAMLMFGLRQVCVKKGLAFGGVFVLWIAIPLMVLQAGGHVVGQQVQARYIAPLVPLIVALALLRPKEGGASSLSLPQTWVLYLGLVIAHAAVLHTQIRRFVTGLPQANPWLTGLNLNDNIEWWPGGPSPMLTWLYGSLGFALLALALFLMRDDDEPMQLFDPALPGEGAAETAITPAAAPYDDDTLAIPTPYPNQ
ncbi:MAG: DUF2142 domain-containing protein [Promicromonosporaceae bacterium]|nr:DUF2142 domain-containing protein [Promicromonosporaceae bacterium]